MPFWQFEYVHFFENPSSFEKMHGFPLLMVLIFLNEDLSFGITLHYHDLNKNLNFVIILHDQ